MYIQRWHGWCHMKLLPSQRILCTPYNHALCHFMESHTRKVHVCLAVTCHLHFWQNGRDLLRATAVTRGWNGYRNKSQHRKLTLENKIRPPLLQGFKPTTFYSRVRRSSHWAIPNRLTKKARRDTDAVSPRVNIQCRLSYGVHASTAVCTLKIPNSWSRTIHCSDTRKHCKHW